MSKIKDFDFRFVAKFIDVLKITRYRSVLTLTFWRNGWKRIIAIAGAVAISILVVMLLISGQRGIGAQEAGRQIHQLAQNIRRHYQVRPDFWGLSTQSTIQQKLYPSDMRIDSNILVGYFGNEVVIGADIDGNPVMPTSKQFIIAYKNLSKLQCIGLISNGFNREFWLGVGSISLVSSGQTYSFSWADATYTLPVSKSKAKKLCSSNSNSIVFHFE